VTRQKRCAFFGLEMPSVENVERMLCQVGRISATHARDGEITQNDFPNITAAAAKLAPAPILFRDDIFDMNEFAGTVRQMKSAFPDLYAVVLDYAQLMTGDVDERSREREVALISRTCRKLSMQLGLCFIVLSQVNDDGKLRESRALGMDATTVVFIEFDKNPNVRNLRLVQRSGKSGIELRVAYKGEHFLFADLAPGDEEPEEPEKPRHNGHNGHRRSYHRD
jgi:replicative DNA helicase